MHHPSHRTGHVHRWYQNNPSINTATMQFVYRGFVRDARDPQKMGRILVFIPEMSGDSDRPENWILCSYCSPFAGASYVESGVFRDRGKNNDAITDNEIRGGDRLDNPGLEGNGAQGVQGSRQSYGMWFTPPDVGNEVIVSFINGDPNFAIWMGCLYQQDMNYMVPGVAADTVFQGPNSGEEEVGPVRETDYRVDQNPDAPKRKAFGPLRDGLREQGLDRDFERGQSISSARRESPSQVFGCLTPNGNHFVMDDGNSNLMDAQAELRIRIPGEQDELIRFRTKSGVQLLLNETRGYVYAISKDGRSWIELSNGGDVDIYGYANVSCHAETGMINLRTSGNNGDINIQASRDINMRADRDIKMVAVEDMHITINGESRTTIQGDSNVLVAGNQTVQIDGNHSVKVGGSSTVEAGTTVSNKAGTDIKLDAGTQLTGLAGTNVAFNSGASIGLTASGPIFEQGANIFMQMGPGPVSPPGDAADDAQSAELMPVYNDVEGPAQPPEEDDEVWEAGEPYQEDTNITRRVPQHEPWPQHAPSSQGFRGLVQEIPEEDVNARPGATTSNASAPLPINSPSGQRLEGRYNQQGLAEYFETGSVSSDLQDINTLQASEAGVDLIKRFEGVEPCVYQDAAGLDTIGAGHLITDEDRASGRFANGCINEDEIDDLLLEDLDSVQRAVRGCINQPLTQQQYDALVSMAFNIGNNGFCNSTLVKRINEGSYEEVPNQMMRWSKARVNGQLRDVEGLVNRRRTEAILFSSAPSSNNAV